MHAAFTASRCSFRILVVEDNAINQKVIGIILREAGFKVDVASHRDQAVKVQRSEPYDLILMDLQMPVMDGWEATRRIRELPQPQPVIVAVTADVVDQVREECLKAGMDDYLSKPFTRDQLLAIVRSVQKGREGADRVLKAS
ncbi:MAG: response regulator [Acidobacteriaceae bacterium]|nr:response regulator [Acidobacteriaceae bacterium]